MTTLAPWMIWFAMALAGVGTFLLRFSFVGVLKRGPDDIPVLARRILRLIPAAVLAAIATPALTHAGGSLDLWNERMLAGVLAALVAWRTKNMFTTIVAGMAVLWLLQALT